jgi:hypothetical protein
MPPPMKNQATKDLFFYWNRLRGARQAPMRTEIEPADIRRHLADTFILERDARGQPVFRLAGTRVCALYGRELKNYSFSSLFNAHDLSLVQRLVQSACVEKSICVIEFEGKTASGRSNNFEAILLPLLGGDESARVFGAVIPDLKPFWLGADVITHNTVLTVKVVDPDKQLVFLENRPGVAVPPIAPSAGDLRTEPNMFQSGTEAAQSQSGRHVRHLTLIEGGLKDR